MQNYAFLNINYDRDYLIEQTKNTDNLEFKIADRKSNYKVGSFKDKSLLDPIIETLPIKPDGMYFFVNPPKKAHIDRGRVCAINFPCNVPGKFFVAKEYPSKWFEENIRRIKAPVDMLNHKAEIINYPDFDGNEEYYYNGESIDKPYMLNTSVPHGVLHDRNVDRFVLTCSYVNTTYEQLYNKLKEVIL